MEDGDRGLIFSYLVQKTFLEGTDAGEQEGCQENWTVPLSSGEQGDKI